MQEIASFRGQSADSGVGVKGEFPRCLGHIPADSHTDLDPGCLAPKVSEGITSHWSVERAKKKDVRGLVLVFLRRNQSHHWTYQYNLAALITVLSVRIPNPRTLYELGYQTIAQCQSGLGKMGVSIATSCLLLWAWRLRVLK